MTLRLLVLATIQFLGLLLLIPTRVVVVQAQAPASEFTFGTYLPTLTPCYSGNVNRNVITLGPISEIVGFTPRTGVRYIRVWSDNLLPFYLTFLTAVPDVRIHLSTLIGGKLNVNVQAFCV